MKNALIIFKKEIKEVIRSKSVWVPSIILSLIFAVIMPVVLSVGSGSLLKNPDTAKLLSKILAGYDPFTALVMFLSKQLLIFLLLVPAMIPSLIAPTSITLEKESRTLEPLLATPVKTSELLLGKTLTSIIPAFVISTFNFILLSVTIDIISFPKLGYIFLPNTEWLITAFILSPAISFIITMVSLTISSRTTDVKSAQGIGSAVILPIYAIVGMQIVGLFVLNSVYLLIASLVLIALCPIFLKLAIRVFDRENILTKWKYK
ncbi:MAG: ABC transporter permease subunit [Actinobacteria bacterium]|nr:ABC transporter permease subunit [Actinomycetota bacterium]